MKKAKLTTSLIALIAFLSVNNLVNQAPAQQRIPQCRPVADQIYFVDSGQMVKELHPGPNGGNGYQLNILGSQVDKYALVKESYMKSVSLVFANDKQAKWQVYFEPKMGRTITSVKMTSVPCKARGADDFPLIETVELLDQ
jgi:hypothetical protein